jgi:ferredoxin
MKDDASMEDYEERRLSGLTIRIDRDLCAATQNCIRVAPEVFVLGDDYIVTFVAEPEDIEQDRLIEACAVCPTDALIAINESGERLVP